MAALCPVCNGSGKYTPPPDVTATGLPAETICHGCHGKGWVTPDIPDVGFHGWSQDGTRLIIGVEMNTFGSIELRKCSTGINVVELQLRLAGFLGTVWDGDFGAKTELQVKAFQEDYMGVEPDGIVDDSVYAALDTFAIAYPIDFEKLKCPCKNCGGFGSSMYHGEYKQDKPQIERYYQYEYPGIHKAILHSFGAAQFYAAKLGYGRMFATSGYRCSIRNKQKQRASTNHYGKAIDTDLPMNVGDDKRDDILRCKDVRNLLVQKSNFQIGWPEKNKKSLEPGRIAPTWIHTDTRCYEQKYLDDIYFVKSNDELLNKNLQ